MIRTHVAVIVVAALFSGDLLRGQPSDPLGTYKEYLGVLAKAESLSVLLPYYTKELSAGLSKMSKEMQANYLKMNRRTLTDLKVVKQQVDAERAFFEMRAKVNGVQETSGTATLVKEGGAWKVDDEGWATNLPKGR